MFLMLVALALAESPVELGGVVVTTLPAAPLGVQSPNPDEAWVLTQDRVLQQWRRSGGAWSLAASRAEPDAVGLFLVGGQVWIERHEVRAEPVARSAGGAVVSVGGAGVATGTTGPVSAAPSVAPAREAKVLRSAGGEAVVDLGREDGVKVGDQLRFLHIDEIPSFSGEGTSPAERLTGAGTVSAVDKNQALVLLRRGSVVGAGDVAELHAGADGYPAGPDRLGGLGEAGVVLRPLLALDTLGVALVNEAWMTWMFESPWYLEARLSPLGFGWSQDGNPLSVGGIAAGGLDARWFSVGLGAGWSMLNGDVSLTRYDYALAEDGGTIGGKADFEDVVGAFSLAQQARLGARDGLNLVVRNTFVLVPEYTYNYDNCDTGATEYGYYGYYGTGDCVTRRKTGSGFSFGGIAMRGTVPVGARTDLFVDWGTGSAGATWVTGGVGTWLRGNGGTGSVGLEVAAGGGQLNGNPDDTSVSLYGPLVSAGVRWRLGGAPD